MSDEPSGHESIADGGGDDVSVFALASVLLRWRRTIVGLAAVGCAIGLAKGLTSPHLFKATASFMPQTPQGNSPTGLALAASQFGINLPSGGSAWSPTMYVELIRSPALLTPLLFDTVDVVEDGRRRQRMIDVVKPRGITDEERVTNGVGALAGMIAAAENKKMGSVELSITSRWPHVSAALAQLLLQRLNKFNLETRKAQAAAERGFIDAQAAEAEQALHASEEKLQTFLEQNHTIVAPELVFERDRLQREVTLRQQLYTSWLQNREDARVREVRDTPVITVLEQPRLPFLVEPRHSMWKGILGGLMGAMLGIVIAFSAAALAAARASQSIEAKEFFRILDAAKPRLHR